MGLRQTNRLLLIGLDGADWQLIKPLLAAGRMPTLQAFLASGSSGNIATLKPMLSPMLWHSIATGKRAAQHGVHGFTEIDPESARVRPVSRSSRRCAALWDILASEGLRCHVINWFASHPAQASNGVCFSDLFAANMPPVGEEWKLLANSFAPMAPSPEIEDLRLHAGELPEEFMRLFIPRLDEIDLTKEGLPGTLAHELATNATVQAAALWAMTEHSWDFATVYFRMVDLVGHHFMKYHPPRLPEVDEREFGLYHDVVNGAYQMFDLMLANLLQQVGPEDTVMLVSDHGFHRPSAARDTDTLLQDPESWHRDFGVLALRGPGIKATPPEANAHEAIMGANLLDITPTILHLFGLPVGEDMRGRVLTETLRDPAAADFIESWEPRAKTQWQHGQTAQISADESRLILRQMEQLGYISALSEDAERARQQVEEQNLWNLTLDHLDAQEFEQALPLIERLVQEQPLNLGYHLRRSLVLWRLGLNAEAEQEVKFIMEHTQAPPLLSYLRGQLALDKKDPATALTHFRQAGGAQDTPSIQLALGNVFLALQRADEAESAFQRALALEEENAEAHYGLARVHAARRDWLESSQAAFRSLSLHYHNPGAHFALGLALERMGLTDQAITAFGGCLKYARDHSGAHRALARLLARTPGQEDRVAFHRASIDQRKDIFARRRARIAVLRETLRSGDWAAIVSDKEATEETSSSATNDPGPPPTNVTTPTDDEIVIVTGLPRSGTSLMMQLLAAGGMAVKTDGVREADQNNQAGYLEWEAIKKLPEDPAILDEAQGQAVKIVSPLIPFLPDGKSYRVVQMHRPVAEVAASQNLMLQGNDPEATVVDETRLARMLANQEQNTQTRLKENPRVDLLLVPYPELVANPTAWVETLRQFIGPTRLPHGQAMLETIKPELYRTRS